MSDLRSYFVVMPVVVPDEPNACRIGFKVGNQMFRFGPEYCEDREQAEWFVDMACEALRTLIADFALRATSETCAHQHPDRKPDDTYCRDCGEHF